MFGFGRLGVRERTGRFVNQRGFVWQSTPIFLQIFLVLIQIASRKPQLFYLRLETHLFVMENKKIFVVDDDKMYATMLADHLEEQGFAVKAFATGEDCLAHLGENPDFIILDYYLDSEVPGAKNGLEILQEIKKADEDVRVIMLSSQEHYGVALQTIAKGAIYYVIKDLQSFKEIDNVLQGME